MTQGAAEIRRQGFSLIDITADSAAVAVDLYRAVHGGSSSSPDLENYSYSDDMNIVILYRIKIFG